MLLNLVLVLAAMFWLSWQLSLVALAVVPLFVLPGKVAVGAGKTTITHLVPRPGGCTRGCTGHSSRRRQRYGR